MKSIKSLIIILSIFFFTPVNADLLSDIETKVDGITRSYDLYLPDKKTDEPRPLVIMYHGHMGSSKMMTGVNKRSAPYKLWLKLAKKKNLIVAVPNGEKNERGRRGWNDCRGDTTTNPETDDVKFTLQMIEEINSKVTIDRERIYATGTSNGGNMVIRLALEIPETFAAVAPVVASNPEHSECHEKKIPISILFMNGTADPLMPYEGGNVGKKSAGRGVAKPVEESVEYWRQLNKADEQPEVFEYPDKDKRDDSTVTRYLYKNGEQDTEVALFKVINGGHTEPSLQEYFSRMFMVIVGKQNHDMEMADEVWKFFENKSRKKE